MMTERCPKCNREIPWPPLCYEADAPWRELGVTEAEFARRVELTADQCVVDEKHFFVRGHIEIHIHHQKEPFVWCVWCSLSEANFRLMTERWNTQGRENDPPMFGWLQTLVPCYPSTVPTKTWVHTRVVGRVPYIEVDREHPLGQEQEHGINIDRVWEFAHATIGPDAKPECPHCHNAP